MVCAAKDIVAGAEYVSAINARASDRRYRAAFQSVALTLAPPGAAILDFGAGPGLDARVYAEQGRRVYAYDVDARMCDYFQGYCRELISAGTVSLTRGHGLVLASVLSPYYAGDLRYGWWWRNLIRLAREGRYFVPGAQARICRR